MRVLSAPPQSDAQSDAQSDPQMRPAKRPLIHLRCETLAGHGKAKAASGDEPGPWQHADRWAGQIGARVIADERIEGRIGDVQTAGIGPEGRQDCAPPIRQETAPADRPARAAIRALGW